MRTLNWMRTLAAAGALLLLVTATPANALLDKPIDSPQGPPAPNPTEVGDPDLGHNLVWDRYKHLFIAALESNPYLRKFARSFRSAAIAGHSAANLWTPRR